MPQALRSSGAALAALRDPPTAALRLFGWWWWRSPNRPWVIDRFYIDTLDALPAGSLGLDLGSRSPIRPDAITLDIDAGPEVDVVGDGHHLPFADATFDYVWSNAVLEHVRDPLRVAREIVRVLKPGGVAIVNVPFLENVHNWPDDYYRYTQNGLRVLFRELEEIRTGTSAGPSQVLPDLVQYYVTGFSKLQGGRLLNNVVTIVAGSFLLPLRALDHVFEGRPTYWRWARSYYFVGRKPLEPATLGLRLPERRPRFVFVAPAEGDGFEEVMGARTVEMVTTLRGVGAEVLAVTLDALAADGDDDEPRVMRTARVYRTDAYVAPNMNYLLKAQSSPSSVIAGSGATPIMLWDDPLGALALSELERRGVDMGKLGDSEPERDVLGAFRTIMRASESRHFAWDSGHIDAVVGLDLVPADAVQWYPIATFEPFLAQGRRRAEERFDVGFCGNVYPHAIEQSNFAADDLFVELTDRICAAKAANLELPVWNLLTADLAALPASLRDERGLDVHRAPFWDYYVYLVWMASTTRVRLDLLTSIDRDVDVFGVFGDPDSVGLLDRHPNLVYRGTAHQSRELPGVFAATRVNVCPSNCLINRGVPSKFVDCLASGGFALVDAKPDLVTLFGPDIETIFFRDADELNAKVEYFLARPQERREIVEMLRRVVERECTLTRLFERMLGQLDDHPPRAD